MLKRAKHVCIALILVIAAYEVMLFAWSNIAEHKAEKITKLIETLKPGYTTMNSAKDLFYANGVNVVILNNACGDPRGLCECLGVGAANFPQIIPFHSIPFHLGQLAGITLLPLPPVKTAYFQVNLYFINGILDSINSVYRVGTTDVKYSRGAGDYNSRSSEWKYANGGMVVSIGVGSSGAAFDVPFPRFAFNYMYSLKVADARALWPTAPPPTTEFHK